MELRRAHLTRHTHDSPAHPSEQPSLPRPPSPRADCILAGTPFRAALGPSPPRQASSRCAVLAPMPFRAVESVTECNALQKAGHEVRRACPCPGPCLLRGAEAPKAFQGSSHTSGFAWMCALLHPSHSHLGDPASRELLDPNWGSLSWNQPRRKPQEAHLVRESNSFAFKRLETVPRLVIRMLLI